MQKPFGAPTKALGVPLEVGATYLDKKSHRDKYHLWFVLAVLADGSILAVNATEHEDGCDETCVLDSSDHPFLYKRSIVLYSHYDLIRQEEAANCVRMGLWIGKGPASLALLEKIRQGALRSPHVLPTHKEHLLSVMGPQPGVTVVRRRLRRRGA